MQNVTLFEEIERQPLHQFTEQAYLDYAMYVILDRALPHIGDGLKPVQRRIVYAMSELGLKAHSKYKKSARTVGDVLGKFHPHGDMACYEAMVLMAQSFSYRYPLIDGQGNWGSIDDPKSFAQMRYTEARLTPFSEVLLQEIEQGTVEWKPNFDGTLEEPVLLPARLPAILLNGGSGIAVGMATDIPPHNLREVATACIHLLKNPHVSIADLCAFLPAPDYPTEAEIITSAEELLKIYQTGQGSIRLRATYTQENGDIVITALPHQTSSSKVITQMAEQMPKIQMIQDIRDESDHENPVRLVVVPRSRRVDSASIMNALFATTELERSYRINFNMIGTDNLPQVKNLKVLLTEWLDFRQQTVRYRLSYRLDKIEKRLHLLQGLLIAYLNIDEIIQLIREEDDVKTLLIQKFSLSEFQADAILELKLRQLAKLEESKIRAEQQILSQEQKELHTILESESKLKNLIIKEIQADAEKYGDSRRSPLVEREQAQVIEHIAIIPSEPVTVILSVNGWVRAAKGHDIATESLNYRAGDALVDACHGLSNQQAIFLDASGRSYSLPAHTLPSARGQGEPLSKYFSPPSGIPFLYVLLGKTEEVYLLASNAGYGFLVNAGDLHTKNKAGKAILTLPQNARLLAPLKIMGSKTTHYAAFTSEGYLSIVAISELPRLSKGKGVKLLNIPARNKEETLIFLTLLNPDTDGLILHSGKQHLILKERDIGAYTLDRSRRGQKLPSRFQKIDSVKVIMN